MNFFRLPRLDSLVYYSHDYHTDRDLTKSRISKPPFPDSADVIDSEIEVNQRWSLYKHFWKPLCPSIADFIVTEIEVIQRYAQPQHFCRERESQ